LHQQGRDGGPPWKRDRIAGQHPADLRLWSSLRMDGS
jgi:hypothetical protein